jgi:hypothetical protein
MKKILYVGSGKSALIAKQLNLQDFIVVCVNNAWRIFEDQKINYWLHSGDFPFENFPKTKFFENEISYKQYEPAIKNLSAKLNIAEKTAVFEVGYTIFFQGLYWMFETIKPDEIYTLGFDHDYNPQKTQKWLEMDKPNPQNNFLKDASESLHEWSERVFGNYEKDFFYGHGTPDPMRLGENHLKQKFKFAVDNAAKLNIKLYNASPVNSDINCFEKKEL